MIKDIKYNGFTETPSDYECPDGDLAGIVGMVPEDEALHPVTPPVTMFTMPKDYDVIFIHKNTGYTHYIVKYGTDLYWIDEPVDGTDITEADFTSNNLLHNFGTADIYDINAVGNTLVVLTSEGMHYILWKGEQINYRYLGTHIPELQISFGLQGEMVREEFDGRINFDDIVLNNLYNEFTEANKTIISNQVLAKVNKFIADNSVNAGKFIFPFFVRYAYRLYDQSLTMHSAPVLMVTTTGLAPQCLATIFGSSNIFNSASIVLAAMRHSLDYRVLNDISDWTDIVQSVDIFISRPIYTYDQNGLCTKFVESDDDPVSICLNSRGTGILFYQQKTFSALYQETPGMTGYTETRLLLPKRDLSSVAEDITSESNFYLLTSIRISDLSTTRKIIDINNEYLQSLVSREVMTDDYDSHDTLIPRYAFPYNSRLNIANISKDVFHGQNPICLFPYTDGFWDTQQETDLGERTVEVFYYIKQGDKQIITSGGTATFGANTLFLYLYHPNADAEKAVLMITNGQTMEGLYVVPLQKHSMLNGAFYFNDWYSITTGTQISTVPTVSTDTTIDLPNKIYTSEVNNPFSFPLLGINTVGTGTILGICAAVKAMSLGQFGQFPLYVFTDEGVWTMEVSDTGTWKNVSPVTRDVCTNPSSITQLDSSVLFVSDRGIMLLSGSNSQCISDDINAAGQAVFDPSTLPSLSNVIDIATIEYIPFKGFIAGAQMLYDYTHQRIFVFNPGQPYAYVYSLKSKAWGMAPSSIQGTLNAYPEALAIALTGSVGGNPTAIVNYSKQPEAGEQTAAVNGVLITRPIKLDAPGQLKTIDTIIQRGYFRKGNIQSILYGSRDLFNWQLVYSSTDHYLRGFRGTPYKYFRIVLLCSMQPEESIFGCTVQYTPRLIDQPR